MDINLIIVIFYTSLLLFFAFKYFAHQDPQAQEAYDGFTSIIVAYRNEEQNLSNLIKDLLNQQHPYDYEIVLINDHSSDGSLGIVESYSHPKIVSVSLPDHKSGKKDALKYGAFVAKGQVLIFTDADCSIKPLWVSSLSKHFTNPKVHMVAGAFLYTKEKDYLSFFQYVEQLFIWGFAKVMSIFNMPVLCNGANIAVRKSTYLNLVGNIQNNTPSGDDIFMLQEIKKTDAKSVVYLDDVDSSVTSPPVLELKMFLNQKIRWASKSGKYKDSVTNITGVLILLFNIYFIYLTIFIYIKPLIIKIIAELFFIMIIQQKHSLKINDNLRSGYSVLRTISVLFIYPFYVLLVAILSQTKSYEWKGRKY